MPSKNVLNHDDPQLRRAAEITVEVFRLGKAVGQEDASRAILKLASDRLGIKVRDLGKSKEAREHLIEAATWQLMGEGILTSEDGVLKPGPNFPVEEKPETSPLPSGDPFALEFLAPAPVRRNS